MSKPDRLSATFVDKVTKPGRYGHGRGGHGLSLLVRETANGRIAKAFSQRIRINGKETNIGLGTYPVISLAQAEQQAVENKQAVARGENPLHSTRGVPTLREAADAVIAERRGMWSSPRSERQWRSTLEKIVLPELGAKAVDKVTAGDIEECLKKGWAETTDTHKKVLQRIGTIMSWAVRKGYRDYNPVPDARSGLTLIRGKKKESHASVHHTKLPPLLERVRQSEAHLSTVLCFEFVALTAARSGEAREATWSEIDFDTRTWTVPAGRMKARTSHKVPLSDYAIEVLRRAELMQKDADDPLPLRGEALVFPSPRGAVLSDSTMSKLCRELELGFVPHGLRATFRDWAAENLVPEEVAEQALAHTVPGVQGAYLRTALLQQRRPLMEDWAKVIQPKGIPAYWSGKPRKAP